MMASYEITPANRVCSATGKELHAGDKIISALLDEGGKFVRKDFAAHAWTTPPAGTIAFWSSKVPTADKPRRPAFNDELLLEWFHHLNGTPEANRQNIRYVVALLLMRRKRLKFEDLKRQKESDVLILRDSRNGARYEILDPRLSEEEIGAVQDEVFQALGW
jgi:hypothetical protein